MLHLDFGRRAAKRALLSITDPAKEYVRAEKKLAADVKFVEWKSWWIFVQRIRSCGRVHFVPVSGVYGAASSLSSFYSRARY